ncbi:MAG: hypothetical protein ACI88G_001577 [Woeseiaceae bacterium]|jgi:uncharacterized protein (TIGR00255 family)
MLNSMTGFARKTAESPAGTLTCELRTVNHRFLDVQFRLPDELRAKEIELRQQIAGSVKRGKIECSVHIRRVQQQDGELRLNNDLVKQIGRSVEALNSLLPATRDVDPIDVLRWPGVIEESEVATEPLFVAANELLRETLTALGEMRGNEGERIGAMLEARCAEILQIAKSVQKRMPQVLEAVRTRQRERIDKLNIDADPARLETELALIAQKLDVDEELDRLESHVSEIRSILGSEEAVGRRLDFLMQELNREANTLGSKSADAATTKAAVELKVLIEQMREQIQNVE